jgi:hypothetical protein
MSSFKQEKIDRYDAAINASTINDLNLKIQRLTNACKCAVLFLENPSKSDDLYGPTMAILEQALQDVEN